jgi:hypothetical protein
MKLQRVTKKMPMPWFLESSILESLCLYMCLALFLIRQSHLFTKGNRIILLNVFFMHPVWINSSLVVFSFHCARGICYFVHTVCL